MKGRITAGVSAIAATVLLTACASKAPASSTATAAANAQDQTSAEYDRLIENATNQRICKRQAVTGSRVDKVVCLTRAEMEDQQRQADEVMREMRETANRQRIPERPPMPPQQAPTGH